MNSNLRNEQGEALTVSQAIVDGELQFTIKKDGIDLITLTKEQLDEINSSENGGSLNIDGGQFTWESKNKINNINSPRTITN